MTEEIKIYDDSKFGDKEAKEVLQQMLKENNLHIVERVAIQRAIKALDKVKKIRGVWVNEIELFRLYNSLDDNSRWDRLEMLVNRLKYPEE